MKSKIRLPTREEILSRMWKLANAGAEDAVRMACFPEEEWGDVKQMDLDAVDHSGAEQVDRFLRAMEGDEA